MAQEILKSKRTNLIYIFWYYKISKI